jgi:hypothetical protein
MRFDMRSGSLVADRWMLLISRDEVRERGLTRPTEPAAPEIKTVSPSFNLPTSNIPCLSAQVSTIDPSP